MHHDPYTLSVKQQYNENEFVWFTLQSGNSIQILCADKVGRRPNQIIFVCCVDGWRKYTSG